MREFADAAVCTVVSKNYLALARTFAHSVQALHPSLRVFLLLVDRVDGRFDPAEEPFEVVLLEDLLDLPSPREFCFKYNVIELNTAVKPFFFRHLMEKHGLGRLIYFDPDILVLSPLDELFRRLERSAALLTPHLTKPLDDERRPSELDVLRAGTFNLGFLGLSAGETARDLLAWWGRRLFRYGAMDPEIGMHVDQNWINLAPVLFDGVEVLRDPVYNVAYWNLHAFGPGLEERDGRVFSGGRPLVFFHFSGFDPSAIEPISKHQDRFTLRDFPPLRSLFERYRDLLLANGHPEARTWPYAFATFDNGVRIPDAARRLYREQGESAARFGNPFATEGPQSFYAWLREPVPGHDPPPGAAPLSRLLLALHETSPALRALFHDPVGRHRVAFLRHLEQVAPSIGLDPAWLQLGPPPRALARLSAVSERQARRIYHALRRRAKPWVSRLRGRHPGVFDRLRRLDRGVGGTATAPPADPASPRPRSALPFGVNVAGYVRGGFGVAEAARSSIVALRAAGVPLAVNQVKAAGYADLDLSSEVSEENPYRVNLVHVNADQVPVFAHERGWDYFRGRRNVGFWYWELARFPERWNASFRPFDEIWAATSFCQEAIARVSPVPVVKMLPAVDLDPAACTPDRRRFGIADDAFVFLFVFDHRSVFERKNPLGAVKAFEAAFGGRRDVQLLIKSIHGEDDPARQAELARAAAGLNVRLIEEALPAVDMRALLASCDAFVSLHRSEGFGLNLAQAMSLGKPVIATAYSGNMDFTTPANAFLVDYRLVELDHDAGPYERGSAWAEPSVEHAAELMRAVVRDPALAAARGARAAEDVRRQLSPRVSGAAMRDRLERLARVWP